MAHAAVSRVGTILGGPDSLIGALRDVVGPEGTLAVYCDWDGDYEQFVGADGTVDPAIRPHVAPFNPLTSRAIRDNGILAEFVRTTPGAVRSANPGASVAAIGARAEWLIADHSIDYGYGGGSPFAKLVAAGGKVCMIGAPLDTMTLLHHAEHLADIPGKRVKRCEIPFATPSGTNWRMVEEFETGMPVAPGLSDDAFATIVKTYLATGQGRTGDVGQAESVLVDARSIVDHAVTWLEARFAK